MPELFDHTLSDRAYAVRLMLRLLGVDCAVKTVDYAPARTPSSAALGGDPPLFIDGAHRLAEPVAILAYLAQTHDASGAWLPTDRRAAAVNAWLAFASGQLASLSKARAITLFGAPGDLAATLVLARASLREIEDQLTDQTLAGNGWMVGNAPTIADIAIFPAVALSHDCGIGLEDYPALNLWQRRVRGLPGFIGMPGIPDYF